MTDQGLARRVELTGWSTVLVGAVCLALAALQAALPVLLDRLIRSLGTDDPGLGRVREAFVEGSAVSVALNILFGAALLAAGGGVVVRARWSHNALSAVSWASIPVFALLAGPSTAPLLAMAGTTAGTRTVLIVVSALLLVAQIAVVLWFLRFWRRREVRALFR